MQLLLTGSESSVWEIPDSRNVGRGQPRAWPVVQSVKRTRRLLALYICRVGFDIIGSPFSFLGPNTM